MHLQSVPFSQSVQFGSIPFLNHHINFSISDGLDLEEFQDTTREGIYCFSMPLENDRLVDFSVDDIYVKCMDICQYSQYILKSRLLKRTPERQQDSTLYILP